MSMPLGRRDKARRADVLLVKVLITSCLLRHMNRQKVFDILARANIDRRFTQIVWERLEEENQVFFQEYYQRLVLMDQVTEFNRLLEKQLQLMNQMNINEGASISTVNASHKRSIPEITAHNTGPVPDMHQPIASSLPGIDTNYGISSWHNAPRISAYHTVSPLSIQQSMAFAEPDIFASDSSPLQTGPSSNLHQPIASGLYCVSDDASSSLHNDTPTDFQMITYTSRFCALPSMVSTQNSNEGLLLQSSGLSDSSHYMFGAVSSGELDASILEPSSPGIAFSDSSSYMFAADSKVIPQARPQSGNASGAASASPT